MTSVVPVILPPRPTIDWAFLGSVPSTMTFARASTGTYFDNTGTLQSAAQNIPRFDYDPLTHEPIGLLVEEQRTNLLEGSASMTTGWTAGGSPTLTTNNAGAPDGSATFCKFVRTTTASSYLLNTTAKAASSLPYTLSVYAKKGEVGDYLALCIQGIYPNKCDGKFNLATGVAIAPTYTGTGFETPTSSIQHIGGGVYRCILTTTTTDAGTLLSSYTSFNSNSVNIDGTDSVNNSEGYLWGAQLEQAVSVSTYIPTTSSSVTRAAEQMTTGATQWYNPLFGAIGLDFSDTPNTKASAQSTLMVLDGGDNNKLHILNSGYFSGRVIGQIWSSTLQAQMGTSGILAGGDVKALLSYAANNSAFCANTTDATDSVCNVPVMASPTLTFSGHTTRLKRFRYWTVNKNSTERKRITT